MYQTGCNLVQWFTSCCSGSSADSKERIELKSCLWFNFCVSVNFRCCISSLMTDDVYHRSRYSCWHYGSDHFVLNTHTVRASCWTCFQTHAQTLVFGGFFCFFSLQHVCTPRLINHCHRCLWQLRHREVRDSGSPLHRRLLAQNKNIPLIWFIVSQQHVRHSVKPTDPALSFVTSASFLFLLALPATEPVGWKGVGMRLNNREGV